MSNLVNLPDLSEEPMDWIDEALKNGMGFKTEEERKQYIELLGDPEMHPMFATNSKDLVGNQLADGIRALREEDKTNVELAIMYKDEGNNLLKNGDYFEAIDKYSYALTFLDKADEEVVTDLGSGSSASHINNSDSEVDIKASVIQYNKPSVASTIDLKQLRSQIISNKALIALNTKNYKTALETSESAISVWKGNMKAHYRKCKALLMLKRFESCLEAYDEANKIEPAVSNDFVTLISSARDGIKKINELKEEKRRKAKKIKDDFEHIWNDIQNLSQQLKQQSAASSSNQQSLKISLGYNSGMKPIQLKEVYPLYNTAEQTYQWPVLFLYPQYNQLDVVHDANIDALLVEYLANMFPEYDDKQLQNNNSQSSTTLSSSAPWDIYNEFQVSNLVAYIMLYSSPRISTKDEWIQSCLEERSFAGLENYHDDESSSSATTYNTNMFSNMTAQESIEHLQERQQKHEESLKKILKTTSKCRYLEIHLGAQISQILTIPNHVLPGGILNLLVYVRGNTAHRKFLESIVYDNGGSSNGSVVTEMGLYGPNSTNSSFGITYQSIIV